MIFGTLLDNLIINAQDRNAKDIHIFFDEDNKMMHFYFRYRTY